MNAVIYYSNTKESYNIASYISKKIDYPILDIKSLLSFSFDSIFLVFPIHYQNIPKEIKKLIKKIKANKAIVLATYGRMSFGNVLYETKKILDAKITLAAYIPVKHAYSSNQVHFNDFNRLDEIIPLINTNRVANIKRTKKNIFANFFPLLRHRLSIKIIKTDKCRNCGKCNLICDSIKNGIVIDKNCNRCLKCYYECEKKGLDIKMSKPMKNYLKNEKRNDFIIY